MPTSETANDIPKPRDELWEEGRWRDLVPLVQADWEAAHARGDLLQEANELASLSFLQIELGRYPEAVRLCRQELHLRRQVGDPGEVAQTLWILALDLKLIGRFNSAIRCERSALAYYKGIGDQQEIPSCLANLGQMLHQVGRSPEALEAFREALTFDPLLAHYPGWGGPQVLQEMSVIYEAIGDFNSAYACQYRSTASLHAMGGRELHAAEGLLRLGCIQRKLGRDWEAREYFREALESFRELGSTDKTEETKKLIREKKTPKQKALRTRRDR